jgi:preprotein translocase subunit YajC
MLLSIFCAATSAFAADPVQPPQEVVTSSQPAPSPRSPILDLIPIVLIVGGIFYIFVSRPQNLRAKAHQTLIESLKKGDSVATTGGIVGKVASISEGHVHLEIAPNVRVRVETASVIRAVEAT